MNTKTSGILRFTKRTKETGQAIVLVAFMIVILIGMLGLAIDGGGMFLLWRDAQNAVDTAALQAAFAYCTSNKDFDAAVETGLDAAEDNGFDNNEIDNWVTIVPAPADRRPANVYVTDNNAIMLVTIEAIKPSYFIQLIYGGPLRISVDTVGICSPAYKSIYEGYAMFAMGSNGVCDSSVDDKQVDTSGSHQHYFGPLFTNGGANVGGGGGGIVFHDGAGIDYITTTDGFDLAGGKAATEDGTQIPLNDVGVDPIASFPPLFDIDEFLDDDNSSTGSDGQYYAEAFADGKANILTGSGEVQIDGTTSSPLEGLYVNPGGGIKVKTNAVIGPNGLTLVATGTISAGGVGTALTGGSWHPYVAGVTMFSTHDPDSPDCNISGGAAIGLSASDIIGFGILYAPNSGITFSSADSAWCGALIANAIDRSGSNSWIFGQKIPSEAELLTYAGGGPHDLPSEFVQYHDRDCDYINNDIPPYYGLGD